MWNGRNERPHGHQYAGDGDPAGLVFARAGIADDDAKESGKHVIGTGYHSSLRTGQSETTFYCRHVYIDYAIHDETWKTVEYDLDLS